VLQSNHGQIARSLTDGTPFNTLSTRATRRLAVQRCTSLREEEISDCSARSDGFRLEPGRRMAMADEERMEEVASSSLGRARSAFSGAPASQSGSAFTEPQAMDPWSIERSGT
jgi:hypothetical protein